MIACATCLRGIYAQQRLHVAKSNVLHGTFIQHSYMYLDCITEQIVAKQYETSLKFLSLSSDIYIPYITKNA